MSEEDDLAAAGFADPRCQTCSGPVVPEIHPPDSDHFPVRHAFFRCPEDDDHSWSEGLANR